MNTPLVARPPIAITRLLSTDPPRERSARAAAAPTHRVGAGCALQLGRRRGELTVISGYAWVTCRDDLRDHVLVPGERMFLPEGHLAVISPFRKDEDLVLRWHPHEHRDARE